MDSGALHHLKSRASLSGNDVVLRHAFAIPAGMTAPHFPARAPSGLRILVVDDSRAQRLLLVSSLRRFGYDVLEAEGGAQALELIDAHGLDLVISDWMMPGMSGPELCQALRQRNTPDYVYFILLTSKSEQSEIARGLELGADDFLTKPFDATELRARLTAGRRILDMQAELTDKNRLLTSALDELRRLYDQTESDLRQARRLQEALVRDRFVDYGAMQVSLLQRSSGHVGGDLVGSFRASDRLVGVYAIDVSGHGISSALMTARLAGHLNTATPEHNFALRPGPAGTFRVLDPPEVVARFNAMLLELIETDHYLTMLFALADLSTGQVRMCQAGHPYPAVQRADGAVEFHGSGGLPVGLLEDAHYDETEVTLAPGDRLFLVSDGITECPGPAGRVLQEDGLSGILSRSRALRGPAVFDAVVAELTEHHGSDTFPDDLSAALLERSAE